jgi:REP element-mobilizing transposase RayT
MTRPRKELISVQDTPYYHVVSRCVRRAYLCGEDHVSGKNYEHRRQWIEDRIRILSSIFSLDICAYAVMSNHLHIAIKLCPDKTEKLSNTEVLTRWTALFKGPSLVQKWQSGEQLHPAELQAVNDCIMVYRKRLSSLSWFMKCLNEPIARQANQEDGCTGHFWQSRFKSQALLTEEALLSCMAYVDLNPVRAKMATSPEQSAHTSIKERINPSINLADAVREQINLQALNHFDLPLKPLLAFEGNVIEREQSGILFSLKDYLELVDYTGRIIRSNKRGAISNQLPPILQRLNIDAETWLENSTGFEKNYHTKFRRRQPLAHTG